MDNIDKGLTVYRIEHKGTKAGMWRNFDGSYNGVIHELTEGLAKNSPMPRTLNHDKNGSKWFSAVESLKQLNNWFSDLDIKELFERGYVLYEINCREYVKTGDEVLFTREGITSQKIIRSDI